MSFEICYTHTKNSKAYKCDAKKIDMVNRKYTVSMYCIVDFRKYM